MHTSWYRSIAIQELVESYRRLQVWRVRYGSYRSFIKSVLRVICQPGIDGKHRRFDQAGDEMDVSVRVSKWRYHAFDRLFLRMRV
jgi:hypothetical protein